MSQHDQGKAIGKYFMPAFTPDLPGMVQEAKTLGKSEDLLEKAANNLLAGDGKNHTWDRINERASDDVVQQSHPLSCVSACGEMLSNGKITQETLISKLDTPCDAMELPRHIGVEWDGAGFGLEIPHWLFEGAPALVTMKDKFQAGSNKLAHAIVIDGRDAAGCVMVRDPEKATKYEMTVKDFMEHWNGYAVFKKDAMK